MLSLEMRFNHMIDLYFQKTWFLFDALIKGNIHMDWWTTSCINSNSNTIQIVIFTLIKRKSTLYLHSMSVLASSHLKDSLIFKLEEILQSDFWDSKWLELAYIPHHQANLLLQTPPLPFHLMCWIHVLPAFNPFDHQSEHILNREQNMRNLTNM